MQRINLVLIYTYIIICTYTDLKRRFIHPFISIFISALGFVINYVVFSKPFSDLYLNLFFVIFLTLVYFLSHNQLGFGDIIMFFTLSFFIHPSAYTTLFFYSFFFASIFSIFYLVIRKRNRLHRIPLAPFILFGKLFYDFLNVYHIGSF